MAWNLVVPVSSTQLAFGWLLERDGDGRGFRVFGTLLGPETTGPIYRQVPALRCRSCWWLGFVCFGSRAWPRPRTLTRPPVLGGVVVLVVGVTGLLFGNCIVDASILQGQRVMCCRPLGWWFFCVLCLRKQLFENPRHPLGVGGSLDQMLLWNDLFVVKFSRAHGGCLGIRSRRRTWESAISLEESITGR